MESGSRVRGSVALASVRRWLALGTASTCRSSGGRWRSWRASASRSRTCSGSVGASLPTRLREERDWDARFDVLERFLIGRVAVGPAPTPAVAWADRRLRETGGNVRVGALAAELGCSRRYLTSRFSAEVRLGPKAVARQVRFAGVRDGRIHHEELTLGESLLMLGSYKEDGFLGGARPTRARARSASTSRSLTPTCSTRGRRGQTPRLCAS